MHHQYFVENASPVCSLVKQALPIADPQPRSTADWTLRSTPELTWVQHMLSLGNWELRHRDWCTWSRTAKMGSQRGFRGFKYLKGQLCACGWTDRKLVFLREKNYAKVWNIQVLREEENRERKSLGSWQLSSCGVVLLVQVHNIPWILMMLLAVLS